MFQAQAIRKTGVMIAVAARISLFAGSVAAQMFEQPRQFKQRDGASMAVFLRSLQNSPSVTNTGSGDSTLLVCGGSGGTSTATANSSCIILNNSDASALIGQDAVGDQDANAESDSTTNTTNNSTTADEVSNILNTK